MLKWSMLRDIEHGSISEGDVIIGGLVAQASKLDVAAPVLKLTRECPENRGIMPRWLTARLGWHAAEIGGPIQSRAFHCRPRSEPEAGDQHLFGTSASAVICSFSD